MTQTVGICEDVVQVCIPRCGYRASSSYQCSMIGFAFAPLQHTSVHLDSMYLINSIFIAFAAGFVHDPFDIHHDYLDTHQHDIRALATRQNDQDIPQSTPLCRCIDSRGIANERLTEDLCNHIFSGKYRVYEADVQPLQGAVRRVCGDKSSTIG